MTRMNAVTFFAVGAWIATACTVDRTAPVPPPPPPTPGTHLGYYVVQPPYGTSTGTGTTDSPWDLATALKGGHGNTLQPGDTVWIRGGRYVGDFVTTLVATPQAPIIFRQYPGERATIDGSLAAKGSNLWFWGFEIMQSNAATSVDRLLGANTENGRFINLTLHDAGISGVSMLDNLGAGVELYGSIVYNNGHNDNLDHGIYAHNTTGDRKYITDNVVFNNCARGIQVYDDGSLLHDFSVVGNISFDNGTISCISGQTNLLVSAPATTSGMVVRDNLLYYAPGIDGVQLLLGAYDTLANQDIDVEGNFAMGGAVGLSMEQQWSLATVRDNQFVGTSTTDMVHLGGTVLGNYIWSGNTYYRDPTAQAWAVNGTSHDFADWKASTGLGSSDAVSSSVPPTPQVFVKPNKYEAGRAFIVVFNFGNQNAVAVDISAVVTVGHRYEIRNVQDVFSPTPIVAGNYAGGTVSIPMGGVQPPRPIGRATRAPRTGPAFDVFLLTSGAP